MAGGLIRVALVFRAPGELELVEEALPAPRGDELLIESRVSAISRGTELLIYRGEAPRALAADEILPALSGDLAFPLRYGYSCVGRVVGCGPEASAGWLDRRVFAFQPHASRFLARPPELIPVPEDLSDEACAFLPSMETALHLVHEGKPQAGEAVVLFGQGVVGLLTTALLARYPLSRLIAFDRYPLRRQASASLGASACLDPEGGPPREQVLAILGDQGEAAGADLTLELTGDPAALDPAIAVTGYHGRIVVGSWYGARAVQADLGGRFHRAHLSLIGSQVSHVQPELTGRWSKQRRFSAALELLRQIRPQELVTHRFPFERAPEAYALLDQQPGEALQVLFSYNHSAA